MFLFFSVPPYSGSWPCSWPRDVSHILVLPLLSTLMIKLIRSLKSPTWTEVSVLVQGSNRPGLKATSLSSDPATALHYLEVGSELHCTKNCRLTARLKKAVIAWQKKYELVPFLHSWPVFEIAYCTVSSAEVFSHRAMSRYWPVSHLVPGYTEAQNKNIL